MGERLSVSFTGTLYAGVTLAVSALSTAEGTQNRVCGSGMGVTVT